MIDIVMVMAILAVASLGSRWLSTQEDTDRHNQFCLGLCTHVEERQKELDPNDPEAGEDTTAVIVGPAIIDHSPNEPAPEGASTGEVK